MFYSNKKLPNKVKTDQATTVSHGPLERPAFAVLAGELLTCRSQALLRRENSGLTVAGFFADLFTKIVFFAKNCFIYKDCFFAKKMFYLQILIFREKKTIFVDTRLLLHSAVFNT